MEFLIEYGTFLAKAVTIVVAIIIVIGSIASLGGKNKRQVDGHIEVTNISDDLNEIKDGMLEEILSEEDYKALQKEKKKEDKEKSKAEKKRLKEEKKQSKKLANKDDSTSNSEKVSGNGSGIDTSLSLNANTDAENETDAKSSEALDAEPETAEESEKGRLFVINFDGDVEASAVESLREEITAIIAAADENDEVLVRLESPGGMVHSYGLAASQLSRIKAAKLKLIITVDEVAASGGYMMACVADEIIAAPFAVVGSIGVVAEVPNIHRLLKHNKVDYETHTAGEFKRTLTVFSENTDAAREKFKQELQETHDLFKQFITDNRPSLDVDKVATGEHWYGTQALTLGLIDKIQTSDDYIVKAAESSEIFEVVYVIKKPLGERLSLSLQSSVEKAFLSLWKKNIESRLFK